MLWIILILVLFLPAVVLLYYSKDAIKNSKKQKEYYQLAIVWLVVSFIIYGIVILTNL
ncbi:hypothetical protein [uncultured Lacinutrix sp.]|uniref:hypothetical protein n=1 Tax=uncultured Lacinutrix sp. TaxID=574032 RepID=UPI0026129B37|nr:hypothetical protein [uncultured Lacinutrix sp.]